MIAEYFAVFMAIAGACGLVFALLNKKNKSAKILAGASVVLIAVGLFFAQPLFDSNLPLQQQSAAPSSGLPALPSAAAGEEIETRLLENQTQVFTQRLQPLVCDQGQLVFWRVFKTYSVTENGTTKQYTTVTLNIENKGSTNVTKFLLKERLPEAVAQTPDEVFNFTVLPYRFENGSVVVTWLFDNIEPGETKSVSYTVEKEIDDSAMREYGSPQVVSQQFGGQAAQASDQPKQTQSGFDFTLPALGLIIVVLAGAIMYFMRQGQREAE